MSKRKRLGILVLVFILLGGIYWGLGNTPFTLPITYLYYAICLILSVLYVLAAGGIRPILNEDKKREERAREKYLKDKGKEHPIKKRDKYRRFTVKKDEEEKTVDIRKEKSPNPLKIPEEKRAKVCQWLLLFVIPLYLIFLLDWVYLRFFI